MDNVSFAATFIWVPKNKNVPLGPFAFSAFSYLGAMLCSNEALKYVNYPTQALGKSCKMIPVMLMGVVLGRKKYSWKEYVSVILITAGIVIFQLGKDSSKGSGKQQQTENSVYGLGLLFVSLFLDGLTGSGQEQMVEQHKPSVHQQMLNTNVWAIYQSLLYFSICSALGQNFIYFTLQRFSALTCTTITTTRKFFTILASVMYFGNPLADQQWVGVGVVFTGIGIELTTKYAKYGAAQAKKADDKKTR
ncbi:hypothetical protein DYB25_005858 [Aphanomyces astaci]|uniref:UAA transporter n=1 Tax=Aphanomyces astaci TaxID=112090 RepID=A0A397B6F0_APHAT|nr:hypothetical protein DYB25_005858 [Aphanomyces astaci]RHY13772.1 hypothetical protein DYB36_004596 [Aphanomyces astaci]RHY74358.1 hypothetical protein DYB34_000088 [Aphanomyces astaci]RHZ07276.1 hypothetical protein DYB31_001107 [Aphanomyces astaci]